MKKEERLKKAKETARRLGERLAWDMWVWEDLEGTLQETLEEPAHDIPETHMELVENWIRDWEMSQHWVVLYEGHLWKEAHYAVKGNDIGWDSEIEDVYDDLCEIVWDVALGHHPEIWELARKILKKAKEG